ncbi:MAG: ABC transporter permease, partial [Thermodesulfovibrio sp.]|nr:ABC transporter permease [Thermodesulfovibrio sp.]
DLIVTLTKKEIKIRYRNSILGYLWSIAHPLAFAVVFYIAFKVVMRINVENYTVFLIAGLFPWQWFANSVNTSSGILIGNSSLIKKIKIPTFIIPLTSLLNDALHFLFSIPIIFLFLFIFKIHINLLTIIGIFFLMIPQILIIYGLCLVISSINIFFRDIERIVMIFTTLLFYFTPIFYPESMIPDEYKPLIQLNPVACLIINWRNILLNGTLDMHFFILSYIYAVLILILGFHIFKKLSNRFAEVL